jgi:nucleotide-binding universal stress UspA family protein
VYAKILVPTDGSDCARVGLDHALKLAGSCGASLHVLNVIDLSTPAADWSGATAWQPLLTSMREHSQGVMGDALQRARAAGITAASEMIELPAGRVADSIVQAAKERGCDLIVMGSHGRRGVKRMLLGSDAELVLRMSSVPVLIVPCEAK